MTAAEITSGAGIPINKSDVFCREKDLEQASAYLHAIRHAILVTIT
jgi:hypothetical protein